MLNINNKYIPWHKNPNIMRYLENTHADKMHSSDALTITSYRMCDHIKSYCTLHNTPSCNFNKTLLQDTDEERNIRI